MRTSQTMSSAGPRTSQTASPRKARDVAFQPLRGCSTPSFGGGGSTPSPAQRADEGGSARRTEDGLLAQKVCERVSEGARPEQVMDQCT